VTYSSSVVAAAAVAVGAVVVVVVVVVVPPFGKNGCISVNFGRTSTLTCTVKRCSNWHALQNEMKPCNSLYSTYTSFSFPKE